MDSSKTTNALNISPQTHKNILDAVKVTPTVLGKYGRRMAIPSPKSPRSTSQAN